MNNRIDAHQQTTFKPAFPIASFFVMAVIAFMLFKSMTPPDFPKPANRFDGRDQAQYASSRDALAQLQVLTSERRKQLDVKRPVQEPIEEETNQSKNETNYRDFSGETKFDPTPKIGTTESNSQIIKKDRIEYRQKLIDQLDELATDLEAAKTEWVNNIVDLKNNDAGKRLAQNPNHVAAYYKWLEKVDAESLNIHDLRIRINGLRIYGGASEDKIGRQRREIEDRLKSLRTTTAHIQRLIDASNGQIGPRALTLELAHKQLLFQESQQLAKELAAARQQAIVDHHNELAAAERKYQAQQEQNKIAALNFDREELELKQKQQSASHQHKLNVKRCQQKDVQILLLPFISPGHLQSRGRQTIEPKGISYTSLLSGGALEPSIDGIKKLVQVASQHDPHRPRWQLDPIMIKSFSLEQMERIKKAQKLLRELGPIMVELNLLSK